MLKKEFKRKDIERALNLIKGKTGDSSEVQIGYNKKKNSFALKQMNLTMKMLFHFLI